MAAVNDDVLTEILLCLPLKSLVRFESVSKHWRCLLIGPNFSQRRYPKPNSTPSGLLLQSSFVNKAFGFIPLDDGIGNPSKSSAAVRNLSFIDCYKQLHILQSCNGLLLCHDNCLHNYYVVNPTTKKFKIVAKGQYQDNRAFCLAFDPSNSNSNPSSSHYKVVVVRPCGRCAEYYDYFDECYEIEIYSSETDTWRPFGDPIVAQSTIRFRKGVFWNGAINWYSTVGNSLYFNVYEESLQLMPMPPPTRSFGRSVRYFGSSGDHLHLVEAIHVFETEIDPHPITKFNPYEMETEYSTWLLKYRFELDQAIQHGYKFDILCVVCKEEDQEPFLVLQILNTVARYKLKDKTLKNIFVSEDADSRSRDWFNAFHYYETLACV